MCPTARWPIPPGPPAPGAAAVGVWPPRKAANSLGLIGLGDCDNVPPFEPNGDAEGGTRTSSESGSRSPPREDIKDPGMEGGNGNCWCCAAKRFESNLGKSLLLGAVGEALAANSLGDTFTPALANSLDANWASKGAGIGTTGRSLVEMPLCCLDM